MTTPHLLALDLRTDRIDPEAAVSSSSGLESGAVAQIVGNPTWNDSVIAATASVKGNEAALLASYKTAGESCPGTILGDFAFAIYDKPKGKVLAATDRMGRRPIYYRSVGNHLHLSSTIEDLLGQGDSQISEQGVFNYVYFHMVPAPGSIYRDIHKLQAGQLLVWENGVCKLSRYWIPNFERNEKPRRSTLSQELKRRLRAAVENCIPDDNEPVGAFLSGGLDSSTVAGMLAQTRGSNAEAFAIGFDAHGYDEMPYARITAKHFGLRLNEYYVTPDDIVQRLPEIATHYGEPFGNSSALPAYFCARLAASRGINHLLAGDGGDEIFAGNERYRKQQIFEKYAFVPQMLRNNIIEPMARLLPDKPLLSSKLKSYISQASVPMPDRMQSYNFLHRHAPEELFRREFLNEVSTSEPIELLQDVYRLPKVASQLDRMLYLDWQFTLADNDLRKVSQMTDLAGVRVSYPMLDDDLIALSLQVPDRMKMRRGKLRDFYKESLRGWLPDATIDKSKQGFGLPFGIWLQDHKPLKELALDNLVALKQRPYFNPDFIDRTIDLHRSGHAAYYGELIWILVVLELWLKGGR